MSVTVQNLNRAGAKGKLLDGIVREQLTIIDDKLTRADRTWGRNVVVHDLPTCISLPGLEKKDAQRILYSMIIRSLEKRKFEVRIVLADDVSTLYIAWTTNLAGEEVEAMNDLIGKRMITKDEIKSFVTPLKRA